MGTNSRIPELPVLSNTELANLYNSLRLIIDDPTFSVDSAKQMFLSALLSNRVIPASGALGYKVVTEEGFTKSIATDVRAGIGRFATATEATQKAAGVFVEPSKVGNVLNGLSTPVEVTPQSIYQSTSLGNPKFLYSVLGHQAILNGSLQPSFGGVPSFIAIYFANLALPSIFTQQAVQGYFVKNGQNYPLMGTIQQYDGYLTQIVLSAGSVGFPVNPQIYVSCSYLI